MSEVIATISKAESEQLKQLEDEVLRCKILVGETELQKSLLLGKIAKLSQQYQQLQEGVIKKYNVPTGVRGRIDYETGNIIAEAVEAPSDGKEEESKKEKPAAKEEKKGKKSK